ncbi:hypothetical protein D3C76_311030 [compost metagenome]
MNICITGSVLCSGYGDHLEDYKAAEDYGIKTIERDFKSLPKVRRTDRLSRICLYTTMSLYRKDANFQDFLEDTGIVLSSKYGPYKVCKDYIEQVKNEGYDMGSPTLFSATVPNAGIGCICRALQLHGPMISERGSDGIISATHMLQSGKSKIAYSIAVDEVTEALTVLAAKQEPERFSEVCNLLAMETEEHAQSRNANVLGYLYGAQSFAVRKESDQLFLKADYEDCMNRMLEKWLVQSNISPGDIHTVLLSSKEGTPQWMLERNFVQNHLPEAISILSPKDFFGESFAASFQNSILFGLQSGKADPNGNILVLDADFEESKISAVLLKSAAVKEAAAC